MRNLLLKDWIELVAAIGAVVAAIAAAISAKHSSKALKIGSNPVLKVEVLPDGIGSDVFFIALKNIGSGLAREIKVNVPAQNRVDIMEVSNLEKGETCPRIKIVEHGTIFYDDPRIVVEYINIFGDKIKTLATIGIERTREKPQAGTGVKWDIDF